MKKENFRSFYIALSVLFSPLIFLLIFNLYNIFFGKSGKELLLEQDINLHFNGKVISEYRQYSDHNVKVEVLNNGYEYKVWQEWEDLISVGDSLNKKKDSLYIIVTKPTGEKIKLDYKVLVEKRYGK